ncbi:MAG: hypothetical protein IH991_16210, partial [Planctomycetes bacterium]|nr:hypothetical protein [Planctomycetota bacterium]
MAISADGKLAAFGEQNGSIKVLELASGKLVQTLKGHSGPVSGVAFSGDGTKLISGSQDKTIRLWNMADGKQIAEPVETPAPVNAVAFVSGDKQVAT